jgi:C-terminal processing protease CtpA/Prc
MEEQDDIRGGEEFLSFASQNLKRIIRKSATLAEFLQQFDRQGGLSRQERLEIVTQALTLLEMNYVHLPLKRALHAVDPIQRLKLLRFRLAETHEKDLPSERQFHQRMLEIFTSARDIHTMYLLPEPFNQMSAYLPFLIEEYFEKRKQKFMISRIVEMYYRPLREQGPEVTHFEPGVEVLYWNGTPVERVIEINGEKQAGSNIEARFARGLDNLTIRPLDTSLPPDERWVTLTYRSLGGEEYELKQQWMVFNPKAVAAGKKAADAPRAPVDIYKTAEQNLAIDHKKREINGVKKLLYTGTPNEGDDKIFRETIKTPLSDVLRAERIKLRGKDFAYLRIFTFEVSPRRMVKGMIRILTSEGFPQAGLILDVRGNGGGEIDTGERLLQLFTPHRVKPELFEFINTDLNLEICRNAPKNWGMAKWAKSIAESVMTSATYSSGFPITPEEDCNDIGQVYYGPVVLITDALSYSTTDIFAAGFQDNAIGEILGTSGNTGAGGANVWSLEAFRVALGTTAKGRFAHLPRGVRMQAAIRRSIRVGKQAGQPLEELGIVPDRRHFMTRDDLLNRNVDLLQKAASILMERPAYRLSISLQPNRDQSQTIAIATKNLARLDLYLNDRPYKTIDTKDGTARVGKVTAEMRAKKTVLLVKGYDQSHTLVAMGKRLIQ